MTTTTRTLKTPVTRADLLARLSFRIHELEMDRKARRISVREFKAIRANFAIQEKALLALPA